MNVDLLTKAKEDLKQLYRGFLLEPEVWKREAGKRDPYRVLIVMGLSAGGVADAQLTGPCLRLFEACPNPSQLVEIYRNDLSKIVNIIRHLNWWGRKLKFVESAVVLIEQHRGSIPQELASLKRKWIGETVAEKIIGYGYGKPALPADSNVCRVFFRICGLKFEYGPSYYDAYVRDNLKKFFDPNSWMEVHELLRLHGQAVCTKNPACSVCNVGNCHFRKSGYSGCDSARVAAEKVIASWEVWRRLLLKLESPAKL